MPTTEYSDKDGDGKRGPRKNRWFVEITRIAGEPWGFRLEHHVGKDFVLSAFSTAASASALQAKGLTVGSIIHEINGMSLGSMNNVAVLLTGGTKVELTLIHPLADLTPKAKAKTWSMSTVSKNENAEKHHRRAKAEEDQATTMAAQKRIQRHTSTRRRKRRSKRAMQADRRSHRRNVSADVGSSDDSTDVEADTSTDDGLDAADAETDEDFADEPGAGLVEVDTTEEFARLLGDGKLGALLDAQETVTLTRSSRGEIWGLLLEPTASGLTVVSVNDGTVAAQCELLRSGLRIDEINGVTVTNHTKEEVTELLVAPLRIILTLQVGYSQFVRAFDPTTPPSH